MEGTQGYYGAAAAAADGMYGAGHPHSQHAGHHMSHHGYSQSHPGHSLSQHEQYHQYHSHTSGHLHSQQYSGGDQALGGTASDLAAAAQQQQQHYGGVVHPHQQRLYDARMGHPAAAAATDMEAALAYRQRAAAAAYALDNYNHEAPYHTGYNAAAQQQDLAAAADQQHAKYAVDVQQDPAAAAEGGDDSDAEAAWVQKVRARGTEARNAAAESRSRRRAAAAADSDEYDINEGGLWGTWSWTLHMHACKDRHAWSMG